MSSKQGEVKVTKSISFMPKSSGMVTCSARNSRGMNKATATVHFSDFPEDITIRSQRIYLIESGHYIDRMDCFMNLYKYKDRLQWLRDGKEVDSKKPKIIYRAS